MKRNISKKLYAFATPTVPNARFIFRFFVLLLNFGINVDDANKWVSKRVLWQFDYGNKIAETKIKINAAK